MTLIMWINEKTGNAIELSMSLIALLFPVDFNKLVNTGGTIDIHLPEWMLINVRDVPAPYQGMVQTSGRFCVGMWVFTTTKEEYKGETTYQTRYENRYL